MKYINSKKENSPIRKRKINQLEKRKYFQSEPVNWEMSEEGKTNIWDCEIELAIKNETETKE